MNMSIVANIDFHVKFLLLNKVALSSICLGGAYRNTYVLVAWLEIDLNAEGISLQ